MKKLLSVLAFAAVSLGAPLAAAQTVGVPLQVQTGEQYTVHVEYQQSTAIGDQEIDATLTTIYALEIVDANARLWRYTPVYINYDLPSGLGVDRETVNINWSALSDAISAFTRVATDIGFECRVDEFGRCRDMTNWSLWSERVENLVLMGDAIARMAPQTEQAEGAPPSWATLREPVLRGIARMLDNYNSQDAAAAFAGIYMPATVQGRTLTRRETVNITDEYEMPFGAPPLRLNGTMRLERIDRRANTGTVVRTVTLDAASTQASLAAMTDFAYDAIVEPLIPLFPEGEEPPTAEALTELLNGVLGGLQYEETTTGVVNLATGMANETTTNHTVSLAPPGDPSGEPMTSRGRITTRVTAGAPNVQSLPRN